MVLRSAGLRSRSDTQHPRARSDPLVRVLGRLLELHIALLPAQSMSRLLRVGRIAA